jgi:hypothetical protein
MWLYSINLVITISLGINPVKGGMPAKDSILIAIRIVITIFVLNKLYIDLIVFELMIFMIRKIGATTTVYIMK